MRNARRLLIAIAIVAAFIVGGTWIYIHVVQGKPAAKFSFDTKSSTSVVNPTGNIDGNWKVVPTSEAGYRVKEILFGQNSTAVGRTHSVTGSMTVSGSQVTSAKFSVDLASITSDESRRDNQFRGRIMNVSTFPTATFKLTSPIDLGTIPSDSSPHAYKATGELSMHGVTNVVDVDLQARRNGSKIEIKGSVPIVFTDYEIQNPSFGPAEVGDDGTMEFSLTLTKA
jgi:polyisoprenoid-binding protein YceI